MGYWAFALERELSNSPYVSVAPRARLDDVRQRPARHAESAVDVGSSGRNESRLRHEQQDPRREERPMKLEQW